MQTEVSLTELWNGSAINVQQVYKRGMASHKPDAIQLRRDVNRVLRGIETTLDTQASLLALFSQGRNGTLNTPSVYYPSIEYGRFQ